MPTNETFDRKKFFKEIEKFPTFRNNFDYFKHFVINFL